jgi:hypothetical protein
MATKKLYDRFQEAFKDPEQIDAGEYQRSIAEVASKASESVEQLTFRLLSLVMLMLLMVLGEINNIDLGFLGEVTNSAIIVSTLLVLISYTHYDLIFTLSKFDQLYVMYKIIVKNRHKAIHEQGLSKYFIFPPTLYDYESSSDGGKTNPLQSFLDVAKFFGIAVVIPLGAELTGFWKLWTLYDLTYSLLLKISLFVMAGITILFNLQSSLKIFEIVKTTKV